MADVFIFEPCPLVKADAQGTTVCPKLGQKWETGSLGVAGSGYPESRHQATSGSDQGALAPALPGT